MAKKRKMHRSRFRLKAEREARIQKLIDFGRISSANEIPEDAIPVDVDRIVGTPWGPCMVTHNPAFFTDLPFNCKDCGSAEIWSKEDQQWFYEEQGQLRDKTAVRCRSCRDKLKRQRDEYFESKDRRNKSP